MTKSNKKKFVYVTPLSPSAQNRFNECMNHFHTCEIKNQKDNNLYLQSINKKYKFIVNKKGDENWKVEK